jgi:uncharacterized protein YndB with AHSA1/START domain
MEAVTSSGKAVVTLPTDKQIRIRREFDAPRHLVYRASTEPELIKRWWAGKRGEVTSVDHDVRVGGRWRNVMVTNDGLEVAFHGTYREIVPDERIVTTEIYEGVPEPEPGEEVVDTMTLAEANGRTTLTILVACPSGEVRDMILASGMEDGLQDALDLLEELAVSLR